MVFVWKDEDHEDLHLDFPDFYENVQKYKISIAFDRSSHVKHGSSNESTKNTITNPDRRKEKMASKLQLNTSSYIMHQIAQNSYQNAHQ